ncbi:MAG: PEGA domain-containing protein [Deltaproteobacteria bacterium]|nr:PEGA domain-containing protein [Deltaproteobacteria bacterium]
MASYLWLDATKEGPLYPGKLELRARPASDLLILLDGDKVADKTPFILAKIDPGEHHIKILRKGYASYERRFTIKPNLELIIDAAMLPSGLVGTDPIAKTPEKPAPKKGPDPGLKPGPKVKPDSLAKQKPAELLVESRPQGAVVFLAGARRGKTPYRFRELKPGETKISVKLKGHRTGSKTIHLKAGASERMLIKLRRRKGHDQKKPPKKLKYGYLLANTRPWSKVYVDDKYTGRQTPIGPDRKLKLRAGKHKVSFETPDGRRFSFEVLIKPDETKKLIKKLE